MPDGEVLPQTVRVPRPCAAGSTGLLSAASAPLPRRVGASCGTFCACPDHAPTTQPYHATFGRLAFNYLEELLNEFITKFRGEVETASRPYAFIKFGAPLT